MWLKVKRRFMFVLLSIINLRRYPLMSGMPWELKISEETHLANAFQITLWTQETESYHFKCNLCIILLYILISPQHNTGIPFEKFFFTPFGKNKPRPQNSFYLIAIQVNFKQKQDQQFKWLVWEPTLFSDTYLWFV